VPKILGVDISGTINRALGSKLLPCVLRKHVPGGRTPGALTSGTNPLEQNFACRGVVSDYTDREASGGNIKVGDRRILVLGDSIAGGQIPAPNDELTIEGTTYRIVENGVKRDPAAATYECQSRK